MEIKSILIPTQAESGVFRQEINTLRNHLEEVLKHSGKWVLIQGDHVVDYLESYSVALTEGYKCFGLETSFMVHEVDALTRPPLRLPLGCAPATLAEAV